jgi:hypothetical protein
METKRQNKWRMKNGSVATRKPVMSTAECRPKQGEGPTSEEVVTLLANTKRV